MVGREQPSYAASIWDFAASHGLEASELMRSIAAKCEAISEKDAGVAGAIDLVSLGSPDNFLAAGLLTTLAVMVGWLVMNGLWEEAVKHADAVAGVSDAAPHS